MPLDNYSLDFLFLSSISYKEDVGKSCRQRKKKGVSSSVKQGRDLAEKPKSREELLNRETNETAKREPYQEAEQELLKLIEEVDGLEEGDLKGLEEKIYQGIFKIGRKLMECGMRKGQESEPVPTQMQGECGHQQKLVGYRAKKLFKLFGEVEWKRAYYQCQVEEDQEPDAEQDKAPKCSHGRAPADERWGVQWTRTTPGVQQYISYLCAMLTLEEAAETFRRLLPLRMSARQALNLMKPVGKALA
jgi:hypothetical protein